MLVVPAAPGVPVVPAVLFVNVVGHASNMPRRPARSLHVVDMAASRQPGHRYVADIMSVDLHPQVRMATIPGDGTQEPGSGSRLGENRSAARPGGGPSGLRV
ncbi:hypothetical protein, partial [Micromonospora sp. KC207]|uniref:hypothetical protein n=1 Tax=Micromonospora sp. KC207 TaxID=2530377 RepID=UPI001A9CCC86